MPSQRTSPVPPTSVPTAEHGPWTSEFDGTWWVIADSPAAALREVEKHADREDAFPIYFGWTVKVTPCLIRWADDYNGEEVCITQDKVGDEETTHAKAWHITWEGL